MSSARALIIAAAAALSILAFVFTVRMRVARPGLALGLVIAGTAGVAAIALVIAAPWLFRSPTPVWVLGSNASSERFSADIPHRPLSVQGSRYVFESDLTEAKLVDKFQAVYPNGKTGSPGVWHVVLGDTMFALVKVAEPVDGYAVAGQYAQVEMANGADGANVAFPISAFGSVGVVPDTPLPVSWTTAEWDAFYGQLGISGTDGSYVVRASNGMEAIVRVSGDTATISFA